MRILHIGKYYPPVPGGMERFLGDLVEAQRAAGHDVAVLVHDDGRTQGRQDPSWLLRCPVWLRLMFTPISPRFPFWLRRAIAAHSPDVIHMHVPNVSAFWALILPSARRLPWIVHWHSDIERSKRSLRMAYPHYHIFERAILEGAECIIVTSPQYLESSQALRPWRHKCRVVPLGVDPGRLPDVDPAASADLWRMSGLRLLAVGRLTYYKGFDTLVRAVGSGEGGEQLVIVGEGEERQALQRLINESVHSDSMRLAGQADDATLCRLMATCDVLCLPSIERTEAFGIVLLEAMRYGKPLLVSDLPGSGVSWVARNGQNAKVAAVGDVSSWRLAIDDLAQHPGQREMLGRLGRQRYEREFHIGGVQRSIESLYTLALKVDSEEAQARRIDLSRDQPSVDDMPSGRSERLLVIIPALNEAACIGEVIEQVRAHGDVDVLVIDDGSTDETAVVALLKGAKVLRAPLWQGAWGAIQTGMRYAVRHGYRAVVTMDADGQHEPGYLPALVEASREADVVIAACPSRGSRMRHIAWAYFRLLTGLSFDDLTSGFRYYNADAYRLLATEEATLLDYQDIGVLLLLRAANLRIAEVAVAMNPRKSGASRVFSSWWTVGRYMAETTLLCLSHWKPARRTAR
jgi:glycosyltransferase involved in cell wall biosynthesis